jgi:hypothetical protein
MRARIPADSGRFALTRTSSQAVIAERRVNQGAAMLPASTTAAAADTLRSACSVQPTQLVAYPRASSQSG